VRVNEVFTSIQGEGPGAGRVATFVRLSGCNLNCSFCDSKYANHVWMTLPAQEVANAVIRTKVRYAVITGGEPLMQEDVWELLHHLVNAGIYVDVETNGTFDPNNIPGVRYIVSPKDLDTASRWLNIRLPLVFKFVVDPDTLYKFIAWVKTHELNGVYFMPKTCNIKGKWECMVEEMTAMGRIVQSELIKNKVDGYVCTRLQNLYRVR